RWLAATHYNTFATRRLFPVLNDTLYANYNISIKHHKNYTALSNMPVQEINMDENNMQWTRFKPTPMMPVYFITASVVHLAFIPGSRITKLWCRTGIISHVQFASTVATNITQFLDKMFPYIRESPEINHVVIPNFHYLLTKENIKFGFVLYGEEDIIFDQRTNSEIRKIDITRVIGYKVIHEWFYNAMDPSMWEPWLSKGFATFFGIY
ncbi:Laeverin, partial [Camponotus floridanus]